MTVSLSHHSFIRSSITATTLLAVGCNQPQANLTSASQQSGQPIRLGLSLWTGSSPWQIAEDKGFLKASGVNTEITWFQTLFEIINQAIKENAGAISILSDEQRTFGEMGALPSSNLTARKLDFNFNTVFYRISVGIDFGLIHE